MTGQVSPGGPGVPSREDGSYVSAPAPGYVVSNGSTALSLWNGDGDDTPRGAGVSGSHAGTTHTRANARSLGQAGGAAKQRPRGGRASAPIVTAAPPSCPRPVASPPLLLRAWGALGVGQVGA